MYVCVCCRLLRTPTYVQLQERVVHDSQQTLEAKSITASSLRHRLSNLKCTLETELEGVLATVMSQTHTYTSCTDNFSSVSYYIHFRVFSPEYFLHTAITHVIKVLVRWSLT